MRFSSSSVTALVLLWMILKTKSSSGHFELRRARDPRWLMGLQSKCSIGEFWKDWVVMCLSLGTSCE